MEEFDYGGVADFIGQNWLRFVHFMEERGATEDDCENIIRALERMAGIS